MFNFKRNRLSQAIAAAAGVAPVLLMPMSVSAAAADPNATVEEIVVTGSRIVRGNLSAPTPITTVSSEDIQMSGQLNSADILRTLPSSGVSLVSSANSNFFTTSAGVNTVELRNLGEDRTLVLVNGRRYVSGLAGQAAVDWNTIPTELIDRIEVITGGASAIYGSDALAGVINVILKDDFEGIEFGYQYGETFDEGDDQTNRMSITMGSNFADDRGNAVLSAIYSKEDGVLARDRSNTRLDDIASCRLSATASCQQSTAPFFSSFSEYGRFFVPSTGASFVVDNGAGPGGTVVPWNGATYGFNRQQFRRYTVPTERYLVNGNMTFEINDNVEAFIETMFARTETESELEPYPHSNSDLSIPGISIDNPFVPAALRASVVAAGDDVIEYFRRTTELGQRGSYAERQTWRALFGLRGDINDSWKWETYFAEGQMQDSQQGGGQINVANMREALNAVDGDGDPLTFDPVCANQAAINEGCSPINIFGLGAISQDAADYVRAPSTRDQDTKQRVAGINLTGDVFELPAGPVAVAFGGEYRKERSADVPDALTQSGQNAGNAEAPTVGNYDVTEFYAEVEVPLLADAPFAHELSVGAAYRYSDYNTVGTTDAYTGRMSWAPIEALRVRAQWARAVRAPNIGELFAPGGENFAPVSDPCNNVTATTAGQTAANCRSIPAIAARIAAVGSFTLTQTEIQGTGGFTSKGNENLDTETSDSWTVGAVFNQELGRVGGLTLSVDWYQIEIEDLIDTVGRQQSVDFCYNTTNFPSAFCQLLVRDTTGAAFQLGELEEVNSGFINEGDLRTEGVDIQASLSSSLADWNDSLAGTLTLGLNYGYLIDFTETKFGVEDDLVGEVGYAENEWLATLGYSIGPFTAQWKTIYVDDSKADKSNALFNFNVGDYMQHDLYASYDVTDYASVFMGVANILDEDAPKILSGIPGNTTGHDTAAGSYDDIGRSWYLGVSAKF